MEGQRDFYGTTRKLTGEAALMGLESAISEGILAPAKLLPEPMPNLYGRLPVHHSATDLAFVAGLAATGLRAAAFAAGSPPAGRLEGLVRRHLPVVVHLLRGKRDTDSAAAASIREWHAAADGFFQFVAASAQEALDLAIVAHRVAELALLPGLNILDTTSDQPVAVPGRDALLRFLGDPDDHVACPTPAQQLLFGKSRRRVPRWFNPDLPVLHGASRGKRDHVLEVAARQQFFQEHLPAIIEAELAAYGELTGRPYTSLDAWQAEQADYLILTQGAAFPAAMAAVDYLRSREKARVGCLNLRLLHPFPATVLAARLAGKKGVTTLEGADAGARPEGLIHQKLRAALAGTGKAAPALFNGRYGEPPTTGQVVVAFRNMMRGGAGKTYFFLDVEFTRPRSSSPRHDILLQAIARDYPGAAGLTLAPDDRPQAATPTGAGLPRGIYRYQDHGPPYSQVTRFYHDTGLFLQTGESAEIVADPFQAIGATPPATALFHDPAAGRPVLPVFQPQTCTGCGQCAVHCPHAAIPMLVIGVEALLRGAMDIAAGRGEPLTQLTPLVKNLARLATSAVRTAEEPVARVADVLPAAFERLLGQMAFSGEKELTIRREWTTLLDIVGEMPVAVTEPFFTRAEQREKGTGELFTLAVDPHACTGCGICALVCEPEALRMAPPTPGLLARLSSDFQRWEQLPDTAAATISRQVHDPACDPFAAVLLSRHYYQSMAGGSPSEAGAAAKTVLHLVTAVVESIVQPRLARQLNELDELIEALTAAIHGRLSDALPRDNLLPLREAMEQTHGERLPLDELVGRLGAREHLKLVDTEVLQRQAELVDDLKDLRRTLAEGPTGAGRSRYGLALAAETWPGAGRFPYNSFIAPVILDAEDASAELVAGLVQGHLRHGIDQARLLRRARLEARGQYRPEQHASELAALTWEALTPEEKENIPPLLAPGRPALLTQPGERLLALLNSSWPVKVLLLDAAAPEPADDAAAAFFRNSNASLFASLNLGNTYVQRDIADPSGRLFAGLRQGLHTSRPALFHLLAADPPPGGFRPGLAVLALQTRAFPAFTFAPPDAGGRGLTLEGNPDAGADWSAETRHGDIYRLTFADWLATRPAWQGEFRALTPADGQPMPVADFLDLAPAARDGKTPVVLLTGPEGENRQLAASPRVIAATQTALRQWRTLQAMAGVAPPFQEKLREAVARELAAQHEEALARVRASYEEKLRRQEQELMENVKVRLREKLLALSRKKV